MLKIEFSDLELEKLEQVVYFTELQKKIMRYRRDEIKIVKMASLECEGQSTISREIKEIERKIKKAYDKNLINF